MRRAKQPFHVWCCCVVLLCFGVAKLGTVLARAMSLLPALKPSEVGEARLMLASGLVELAAVLAILWLLSTRRACQLVALLGASFLIYRFCVNPIHCPCMGAAPSLWPWLHANEQFILLPVAYGLVLLGLWGWAREVRLASAGMSRL